MVYLERSIEPLIEKNLFCGKAIVVYGARRVGKTTLVQHIAKNHGKYLYLNCDEPDIRSALTNQTSSALKKLVGNNTLVIIDEAQRVENIGLTLKLMVDQLTSTQVIATGSSSLDLANKIKEPLTGRSVEVTLYPLSIAEKTSSNIEAAREVNHSLIYGGYPLTLSGSQQENAAELRKLATDYLYKDAFNSATIYDTTIVDNILRLLAFQIGSEVSYSEIGSHLDISKETVMRYISLLEHARIIFRLNQYRVNQRSLVGRLRKVYFYDLGVRNGIIDNFKPLDQRDDVGRLFENLAITERLKRQQSKEVFAQPHYWRTKTGQEVDYIEAGELQIAGFEFKYKPKKISAPSQFVKQFPESTWQQIHRDNVLDFIL